MPSFLIVIATLAIIFLLQNSIAIRVPVSKQRDIYFFYFNVLQIPKLTRSKPEIRDFINLSEHKTCNYAYESCSESNVFYFTMLAHNVRGKWW